MPHPFYLFAYTFCLAISLPLFTSWHLLFFVPFLVKIFYRYSLIGCLCWAVASGLIIDLLSSQTRLGIYAINYCLTTVCLYHYRFYFFEDRPTTLPVMTFCFSALFNLIQSIFFYAIGIPFIISWDWIIHSLFSLPFQNALYAWIAFILPSALVFHIQKRYSLFRRRKRRKT